MRRSGKEKVNPAGVREQSTKQRSTQSLPWFEGDTNTRAIQSCPQFFRTEHWPGRQASPVSFLGRDEKGVLTVAERGVILQLITRGAAACEHWLVLRVCTHLPSQVAQDCRADVVRYSHDFEFVTLSCVYFLPVGI